MPLITFVIPKIFHYLVLSLAMIALTASCSTGTEEEIFHTPCENGFSEEYPCSNIGLYAHLTPEELMGTRLNDVWGWKDPETGREYALVGLTDGITIVDVTEPWQPVVIGKVMEPEPEHQHKAESIPGLQFHEDGGFKGVSTWRDAKVYRNTLYIVSEQAGYGLQFFDLEKIRDVANPPVEFHDYGRYLNFGNAHNVEINTETGFAYVVGATSGGECASNGGLHMVDLSVPHHPQFAGCYVDENAGGVTRNGYIHDTQCVIYKGPDSRYQGREICFNSSEKVFLISDVTYKTNPYTISIGTYEGSAYMHQGWLTEDHQTFFMNDELDESRFNHNTRTYVWNVQNLEAPEMIGFYEHPTRAADHNLYIKDDFMYQANYTGGLRVLDVSNPLPANITEVGFFDTTPDNDDPVFAGLWSVYPWLSGNTVIVSDINNGLFILHVER